MIEPWNQKDIDLLQRGAAPQDPALLGELSAGLDSFLSFLGSNYLKTYLPEGGSKVKFVTGRPGSGKTHLSLCLLRDAEALGYLTVRFSAKEIWLHDFREIYLQILCQ